MFRRMLMGATVFRAPEDDAGLNFDDDDVTDDLDADTDLDDQGDDLEDLDGQGDPDPQPEPARAPRGANRVAEATRIAAEAKAEAEALKREIEALKTARPTVDPRLAAEERQQRLAAMSPDQRTDFLLREQEQRFEARLAQTEFSTKDAADAAEFRTLCSSNPAAAKLSADVEEELAKLRANGQTAPRETILKYLLGERMLSKAPKARQAQVRQAAGSVARNAVRPGQGRSDVTAGNRRGATSEAEARRQRLEGLKF